MNQETMQNMKQGTGRGNIARVASGGKKSTIYKIEPVRTTFCVSSFPPPPPISSLTPSPGESRPPSGSF